MLGPLENINSMATIFLWKNITGIGTTRADSNK
jgi:hypothetical protein